MLFDRSSLGGVVLLLVTVGCARMPVNSLAGGYHGPNDEIAFWSGLNRQKAISNHDALLGLALLADSLGGGAIPDEAPAGGPGDEVADLASPHRSAEFNSLVAFAKQRQWMDEDDWLDENGDLEAGRADVSARFGLVAVAACDLLDLRNSINQRLFKNTQRYSTRELSFQDMTPLRTPAQSLSGAEFLGILHRVKRRATPQESAP